MKEAYYFMKKSVIDERLAYFTELYGRCDAESREYVDGKIDMLKEIQSSAITINVEKGYIQNNEGKPDREYYKTVP